MNDQPVLLRVFSVGILLVALAGCTAGTADQPELGQVTGVVTLDGKPLPNVTVTFEPQSGNASFARTDEQGKYELGYIDSVRGAVIGTHRVTISTPQDAPAGPGSTYVDPIPAKYNTATTLTKDVVAGENVFNFELQSK